MGIVFGMNAPATQIALFTDFGPQGPYVGQVKSVLARLAPEAVVIDLLHDLPPFSATASGYLLAAYSRIFPMGTVFVAVVDPGVGTQSRQPVVLHAEGRWFVGPDNGLFDALAAQCQLCECCPITWLPEGLSASFHGRDLFAPVAATIANGGKWGDLVGEEYKLHLPQDKADLYQIVYIDRFGNATTGIRASSLERHDVVRVGGQVYAYARVFGDAVMGEGFWYENSNGLVEIALNQGSAAQKFGLAIGDCVSVVLDKN